MTMKKQSFTKEEKLKIIKEASGNGINESCSPTEAYMPSLRFFYS